MCSGEYKNIIQYILGSSEAKSNTCVETYGLDKYVKNLVSHQSELSLR